jgi:hypothetical protein
LPRAREAVPSRTVTHMGSHRPVHAADGPSRAAHAQLPSERNEGPDISINAWRIVVILTLLAAIAAAALFAAGVTDNTDSAHSYGDLGRAAALEPVV